MSINSEPTRINSAGQASLGGFSSLSINAFVHPLSTIKNRMMANPHLTMTQAIEPKGIYNGYRAACSVDGSVFALAFVINGALQGRVSDLNASIAAGALPVPIVSFGEGLMANRQVEKLPYSKVLTRALRPAGLIATMAREVPFTVAVFYLSPTLQKKMSRGSEKPSLFIQGIAGILGGSFAGLATTPADLVKTRIHTHERSLSIATVVRSAVAEKGWRGLWRGAGTRSVYIGLTGAGMNIINTTLPRYLPKAFHSDQ